jgi:chromosome segregation ATPase
VGVTQQNARVVELEEANAQLRTELNAAQSRLVEVNRRRHALTSDYEGLRRDFDILRTLHDAVVNEKMDLEKIGCEKVQRLQNSLHKKLAELRVDIEATVAALGERCMDFPSANTIVNDFLVVLDGSPGSTHRLCRMQWEYHLLRSDWCFQDACGGRVWAFAGA